LNAWAAVVFGASSQTPSVNTSDGVGILIRGSAGYEIFDGTDGSNTAVSGGLTPNSGYYDVRINYHVPAFDNISQGFVSIFVDDVLVRSFQTLGGFANNYITLIGEAEGGTSTTHGFRNLRIWSTAIPEPSTFAIWALGLMCLGWYGWRRRRTC